MEEISCILRDQLTEEAAKETVREMHMVWHPNSWAEDLPRAAMASGKLHKLLALLIQQRISVEAYSLILEILCKNDLLLAEDHQPPPPPHPEAGKRRLRDRLELRQSFEGCYKDLLSFLTCHTLRGELVEEYQRFHMLECGGPVISASACEKLWNNLGAFTDFIVFHERAEEIIRLCCAQIDIDESIFFEQSSGPSGAPSAPATETPQAQHPKKSEPGKRRLRNRFELTNCFARCFRDAVCLWSDHDVHGARVPKDKLYFSPGYGGPIVSGARVTELRNDLHAFVDFVVAHPHAEKIITFFCDQHGWLWDAFFEPQSSSAVAYPAPASPPTNRVHKPAESAHDLCSLDTAPTTPQRRRRQTPDVPMAIDDDDDTSGRTCSICMDNPVNACMVPCFHASFCLACANDVHGKQALCPICRGSITRVQRIFL